MSRATGIINNIECRYYNKIEGKKIICGLCPQNCIIADDRKGFCGVRRNKDGILYSDSFGKISALAFDPIEKKPLYHFFPGKQILSIGSLGCNLKCVFCQNSDISQNSNFSNLNSVTPDFLLETALSNKNNIGIAYTYNEPLINFEFVCETAKLFSKYNLKNVLVSNGLINEEPLKELLQYIDAANIDLKGITNEFYKKNCGAGTPENVLNTIKTLYSNGKTVEATNLIVTGANDKIEDIKKLVDAISDISKNIPLHFSRYFPRYKYEMPPTDEKIITAAFEYAKTKLNYVYAGNIHLPGMSNTYCPDCGCIVIEREYYQIKNYTKDGRCKKCGEKAFNPKTAIEL